MNTTGNDTITITTIIHASIENVWKAWTDPVYVSGWFGSDPKGVVLTAALDVRVGGAFEITFQDSDQTEHTCFGIYSDVQKFYTLKFSWSWKSESGVESFVTLALLPENNFTRIFFQQTHIGTTSSHNYVQGWKATFAKLERMLISQNM